MINKKFRNFLVLLGFLMLSFLVNAQFLVEASLLSDQLSTENNLVVIDVRKKKEYSTGHIPGALQIWRTDIQDTGLPHQGLIATRMQIEKLFSRLGITNKNQLVLYDENGNIDAARLRWILEIYGFTKVQLLNGGLTSWKFKGYQLETTSASLPQSTFSFPSLDNRSHFASLKDMQMALDDPNTVIVDARTESEYNGSTMKEGASRAGHIPGSILCEWIESINFEGDKKFKSINDLKSLFEKKGITPDKKIIVYCHSGVRSAHTTYVLTELLAYQNVKNYSGSWTEWSHHKELPIVQYAGANFQAGFFEIIKKGYTDYANYLWDSIKSPSWHNYFYWLIGISLFFFLLEFFRPWRKSQPKFRKDFWLDVFYMFFNFFLFSLIIYNAASDVVVHYFNNLLKSVGIENLLAFEVQSWPVWGHLLLGFFVRDFVQWLIHRLLHRSSVLWEFHKVHHSVEQMGFAAHLRYHWMENVVYRTLEYIPLALIGIGLNDFFIIHIISLSIGHWNHSNFTLNIGPLKYIFNNPAMHIWHHSYYLPNERKYGVNFGLSLSLWDYLFGTSYIPHNGRDIKIGFRGVEEFPDTFLKQNLHGFKGKTES